MIPDKDETITALCQTIEELEEELENYKHVVFTLAMINRDAMTEHDEALLEEALTRAKELYNE